MLNTTTLSVAFTKPCSRNRANAAQAAAWAASALDAEASLDQALKLRPGDPRASYLRAGARLAAMTSKSCSEAWARASFSAPMAT